MNSLKGMLIRHEGLRLHAYLCSAGKITLGCGRNIEELGITGDEAMVLLDNDIKRVQNEAATAFPWFLMLDQVRRDVIISMIFNLGLKRFLGFKSMIVAVQKGYWERAATEMLNSAWSSQVKGRAVELAKMMRSGQYPS